MFLYKACHGPLVKWLRQRPLTPLTSVRIRYGSPLLSETCVKELFAAKAVDKYIVGADWYEGPPVPIPNTEVKLVFAEDTCRVTGRENRQCQHIYSSLAQPVEHLTVNQGVVGSSPTGGAKHIAVTIVTAI